MSMTRWDQRFFATTRGRIVALLRRSTQTVDQLAAALQLTDNAVRAHLATLERDGLVYQSGLRRGGGKPAFAYDLTPDAERLFPKAYAPVLAGLLDALAARLAPEEFDDLLRRVGRRLAAGRAMPSDGLRDRLEAAVAVLAELGGLAELEEREDAYVIRGFSCPLAAVVPGHPQVCRLAEALLAELIGAPVRERCEKGERPRCRFEVPRAAAQAAPLPADQPAAAAESDEPEPPGGDPPCWEHLLDDAGRLEP